MVKTETAALPRHIAIIMDSNGRWAKRRLLPRQAGHRAGLTAARRIIESCIRLHIGALTLFAFSSENWQRPRREVGNLMGLLMKALEDEVRELHTNNVRLRFIGALDAFSPDLRHGMRHAAELTAMNAGLALNIAASYGGRWDIVQAAHKLAAAAVSGHIRPDEIDEARLSQALMLPEPPDPDLFIRTGGEQRISNFLLWNLAYTELYFTDSLWPDFDEPALQTAFDWYAVHQRRFGRTPEQVKGEAGA